MSDILAGVSGLDQTLDGQNRKAERTSPGLLRTSSPPCFNPAAHGDQTGHQTGLTPPSGPDRLHAAASEPDLQIFFTELTHKLVQPFEDFYFFFKSSLFWFRISRDGHVGPFTQPS